MRANEEGGSSGSSGLKNLKQSSEFDLKVTLNGLQWNAARLVSASVDQFTFIISQSFKRVCNQNYLGYLILAPLRIHISLISASEPRQANNLNEFLVFVPILN